MYLKDKQHYIGLRLDDDSFLFVKELAENCDLSVSEVVRQIIKEKKAHMSQVTTIYYARSD